MIETGVQVYILPRVCSAKTRAGLAYPIGSTIRVHRVPTTPIRKLSLLHTIIQTSILQRLLNVGARA